MQCINCQSDNILEQVKARGIFTRRPNVPTLGVCLVSWEPTHDFYECLDCSFRFTHNELVEYESHEDEIVNQFDEVD